MKGKNSTNDAGQRGWLCKHDQYGTWFLSFDAVKADKLEALKDMEKDASKLCLSDADVESWFYEQCGWVDVAARGVQLEKPDMAAWEKQFYESMREDGDGVEDPQMVSLEFRK